MNREFATQYVDKLLEPPTAVGSGKRRPGLARLTPSGEEAELIPGLLYRCDLLNRQSEVVTLTLYMGVGGLGGVLWEQELRTLERISGLNHPALPLLGDGGHLDGIGEDAGAAYILTYRRGTPAAQDENRQLLHQNRGTALPHLWLIADGLAELHAAKISHRGLWPGALSVERDLDGRLEGVRLARFEMSALLANLFRMRNSSVNISQLKGLYLKEDPTSRVYMPPERLDFIFGLPNGDLGGPKGDIFSLGMIAADWFLGEGVLAGPVDTREDVAARHDAVRRALEVRRHELPGQLAEAIGRMLDPVPDGRPTAYEVSRAVSAGYADARAVLSEDAPDVPYLVGVMPDYTDQTLLRWHLVQDSALTEDGLDELIDLVEQDMRGAEIVHSPTGAEGFASGSLDKLRRAKTVVIGPQVTWFCEHLRVGSREFKRMMVVKFVRKSKDIRASIDRLRVSTLVRSVPMVEAKVMPTDVDAAQKLCDGRPDWNGLIERVESGRMSSEAERDYLASLEWYIHYQRALLEARTYAYELVPNDDRGFGTATLRWNSMDDRLRMLRASQPLSSIAILDERRPELASFVRDNDEDSQLGRVRLAERDSPFWDRADAYDVVDALDPDTVIVSLRGRKAPPERGWLRLEGDVGTEIQIHRQAEAIRELSANRVLLQQLIKPQRRRSVRPHSAYSGTGLEGEGRAAVQDILGHDALFALQGPPGTGKTEVASEAVAAYVQNDPGARVLVSAQSHDALENLAVRICRKLGIVADPDRGRPARLDRLALRVESRGANRDPHPELAAIAPANMADRVIGYSQERAREWLKTRRAEQPELIPVVQDWIKRIRSVHPELSRRVKSAANVVFATTGVATSERLAADASDEPFDWVVVEEAGRAWPTELALPLVRGLRWTLVGDHAQIGAYRKADVERFLLDLGDHGDDEVRAMYEARDRHIQNFNTFARLFDGSSPGAANRVLKEQYRMDESISQIVGDVFYSASGGLRALRERAPHPLERPGRLRDHRLIWIDTGRAERSVGDSANDYEAALCSAIVRQMEPSPGRPGGPSLAILTPYRNQVKLLQNHLLEHIDRIHTVDGFQGREADIVVASLVRDRLRPSASVIKTVGHVATPERINVLLSRAREMLIVVGRIEVFANAAGPEWASIVDRFRAEGTVLAATDWASE